MWYCAPSVVMSSTTVNLIASGPTETLFTVHMWAQYIPRRTGRWHRLQVVEPWKAQAAAQLHVGLHRQADAIGMRGTVQLRSLAGQEPPLDAQAIRCWYVMLHKSCNVLQVSQCPAVLWHQLIAPQSQSRKIGSNQN